MKWHKAIVGSVLSLLAACATVDVNIDYDRSADFSRYKTYAWLMLPDTGSASIDRRIVSALDAQLGTQGWRKVKNGQGDASVGVEVVTQEEQRNDTYYDGWILNQNVGAATTVVTTFREGTLIVDIFDSASKKSIWRGIAHETISRNPEKNEELVRQAVQKMFQAFPPLRATH